MQKMTRNSAIIGVTLLSTILSGLLVRKNRKNIWKSRKCPEKARKNWKNAILWSAFTGMVNGVFKLFIKEGQRKLSHKK